jgi:predicted  nucleic acid-binding Zn-ribbon protein
MLTTEQIQKIITENEHLRIQLNEVNEILALREEEIEILKQHGDDITALRSQLELQLIQTQSLENTIAKKQQQVLGGVNRERELEDELIDAANLLKEYSELKQKYTHIVVQITDLENRVEELTKRNELLQNQLSK